MRQFIYYMLLQPLTKMIKKATGNSNEDDDHFNHPYVIL